MSNIREFVRLSESGVDYGEQGDWSIEDEFSYIISLRNELYVSYIRKGNINEIRTLITIANDRIFIAGLLLGNLPDNLLDYYKDFIGDNAEHIVRHRFKTFYHDRYVANLNRILANTRQILFINTFRFAYFVLSPEELFEFTERISYESIQKQERLEYIRLLASYAEYDGLTIWARLVRALAKKKLISSPDLESEEEQ